MRMGSYERKINYTWPKSLRTLYPHIWNSVPDHMKVETKFIKFREYVNQWLRAICKCNLCVYINK